MSENPFVVGQKVALTTYTLSNGVVSQPPKFDVGHIVTVSKIRGPRLIEILENGRTPWNTDWFVPVESTSLQVALPYDTSRQYAFWATSRSLTPGHNEILQAASQGERVDVLDFRRAATAALSLASTRAGGSPERRRFASQARHLIYWADAIIDNHIAQLPAYQPGERSPKIAELQEEIDRLRVKLDDEHARSIALIREKTELEESRNNAIIRGNHLDNESGRFADRCRALEDDLSRTASEREKAFDDRDDALAKLQEAEEALANVAPTLKGAAEVIGDNTETLTELERERDILATVLAYAVERLGKSKQARVLGFWDAFED